jgi:hypothetical protein
MVRVNVMDEVFNQAYWNAKRTLPVEPLETPRQYGQRCRESFGWRVDPNNPGLDPGNVYYIFDNDEDYTMFMLRWA